MCWVVWGDRSCDVLGCVEGQVEASLEVALRNELTEADWKDRGRD